MQVANVRLRLNKVGSDVPIKNVTPAEAQVLHVLHQANNGGSTFGEEFDKIEIIGEALVQTGITPEQVIPAVPAQPAVGEVGKPNYKPAVEAKVEQVIPAKPITRPRTAKEELQRLTRKYGHCVNKKGDRIVKLIWPESDPKLPQKFSDIDWKNVGAENVEVASLNYATGKPAA
jgi:hypothetical protein